MTRNIDTDDADNPEPITLTVDIDPSAFDEPRQLMYDRLCEEFGDAAVEDLLRTNLDEQVTAQAMQLVNALWDNRDQIAVDDDQPATPEMPDHSEGLDE